MYVHHLLLRLFLCIFPSISFQRIVRKEKSGKLDEFVFVSHIEILESYYASRKMVYIVEHNTQGSDAIRSSNYNRGESCSEENKVLSTIN